MQGVIESLTSCLKYQLRNYKLHSGRVINLLYKSSIIECCSHAGVRTDGRKILMLNPHVLSAIEKLCSELNAKYIVVVGYKKYFICRSSSEVKELTRLYPKVRKKSGRIGAHTVYIYDVLSGWVHVY